MAAGFTAIPPKKSQRAACEAPITFKIGALDARFGISRSEFQSAIEQAGGLWGGAINRKLFEYSPDGDLTINLVYDVRQQQTQIYNELQADITGTDETTNAVTQELGHLEQVFKNQEQDYAGKLATFNRVKAIEILAGSHDALNAQNDSLKKERLQLTQLNFQINTLIDKRNSLAQLSNAKIATLSAGGIVGTEFEAGQYVEERDSKHIEIYQFKDRTGLLLLLAHELGHALGLAHNLDPRSVMAALLQTKIFELSRDDLAELRDKKSACFPNAMGANPLSASSQ